MSAVPVQKPIVVTRPKPQLRVEQGIRPSTLSRVVARSVVFGVLTLGIFFASSLAGQVMVEKARRDGIRAAERLKTAGKEQAILRDRVLSMTRSSTVSAWAQENGFVSLDAIVEEGGDGHTAD
jgi:hypothetical protein